MHLRKLAATFLRPNSITHTNFSRICLNFFESLNPPKNHVNATQIPRNFQTTSVCLGEDRRSKTVSAPTKDEGVAGEYSIDLDSQHITRHSMFPDENSQNLMFDGIRFADLPVCHVKATKNNTLMTVTDRLGRIKAYHSCGMEGFRNTKKATNVAAQVTGISVGKKALAKGITTVRVKVRGLGPGRMTSVRGLQMAGVNIIAITDDTPVPHGAFPRPRKQRKL